MNWRVSVLLLLLTGCPERKIPEGGLQLVFSKPTTNSVRAAVDRRLAQLKLRANLSEDDKRLTVRLPEDADTKQVKALFAEKGQLEFCSEEAATAEKWCQERWPEGIRVDEVGKACALIAEKREQLETALGDAGTPYSWGKSGKQSVVFSLGTCFAPRVVSAEAKVDQSMIALEFDRVSGREFSRLTTAGVGRRLLIRLDGVVESAPLVMEPITGGKAMLNVGSMDLQTMEVLAAALVGGALPELVLESESRWGAPSLKR